MLRVLKDSTDTVSTHPRLAINGVVSVGVPASCTARRVTPGETDASYQSATIDSLSTTVQGVQQLGADLITLAASVAIVAGRKYAIQDAAHGRTTIVQATNTGTSATMYLAEPLTDHITNGSTVKGVCCSIALSATQTSVVGQGFVYFRATVDGIVREWDEPFRIVRRITSVALTPTELTQAYPTIRSLFSNTDLTNEEAINSAWKHIVVPALSARGILDEDILTDDLIVPFHAAATILHLANQWPAAPSEFVQRLEANCEKIKQTLFDRIDFLTSSQDEEAPRPDVGSMPTLSMRLSR